MWLYVALRIQFQGKFNGRIVVDCIWSFSDAQEGQLLLMRFVNRLGSDSCMAAVAKRGSPHRVARVSLMRQTVTR